MPPTQSHTHSISSIWTDTICAMSNTDRADINDQELSQALGDDTLNELAAKLVSRGRKF
ncbi:hypothetical protein GGD50_006539 [Rhizobium paranaense]|uniref:Uncharacterized protein n=1 Tax=Rhizobium paranaense TaxID=1650438 RepID=A0A7W8XYF2_9HYPH|nr:hypothetical protein [Rhizobium paranaense]